jgi:hypothetical protein
LWHQSGRDIPFATARQVISPARFRCSRWLTAQDELFSHSLDPLLPLQIPKTGRSDDD